MLTINKHTFSLLENTCVINTFFIVVMSPFETLMKAIKTLPRKTENFVTFSRISLTP